MRPAGAATRPVKRRLLSFMVNMEAVGTEKRVDGSPARGVQEVTAIREDPMHGDRPLPGLGQRPFALCESHDE